MRVEKLYENKGQLENIEPLIQKVGNISWGVNRKATEDSASVFIKNNVVKLKHDPLLKHAWLTVIASKTFSEDFFDIPNYIRQYMVVDKWVYGRFIVSAPLLCWYNLYRNNNLGPTKQLKILSPTLFKNNSDDFLRYETIEDVPENYRVYTFMADKVSRGCNAELRTHSWNVSFLQRSTRYVNEKEFDFIAPPSKSDQTVVIDSQGYHIDDIPGIIRDIYTQLTDQGMKKQDARQYLPIGINAPIAITVRHETLVKSLKHSRVDGKTGKPHWEIKKLCEYMLSLV